MVHHNYRNFRLRLFSAFFLVGTLFLVSCTNNPWNTGRDASERVQAKNYYSGTKGLTLSFLEGQPPRTLFESQDLPVAIKVANEGVADAYDVRMLLFFQDRYFKSKEQHIRDLVGAVSGDTLEHSILGTSEYNPIGDQTTEYFTLKNVYLDDKKESISTDVKAILCYRYYTIATATLCVNPDSQGLLRTPTCNANQDIGLSEGQGSPVSVTHVQEYSSKGQSGEVVLNLVIYVRNMGAGKVVDVDEPFKECAEGYVPPSEEPTQALQGEATSSDARVTQKQTLSKRDGIVKITSVRIPGTSVDLAKSCSDTLVRLEAGKEASFSCAVHLKSSGADYTTALTIELDYGYVDSAKAPVDIKRVVKNSNPETRRPARKPS